MYSRNNCGWNDDVYACIGDDNLITLPITCNQVIYIMASVIALIGVIFLFNPIKEFMFIGVIILGVEGVFAFAVGLVHLMEFVSNHVQCSCDK